MGSGLGGKAGTVAELLGLELLRDTLGDTLGDTELLGPGSQKLLLGLAREGLGSKLLLGSTLLEELLLGLLGELGLGLTVQLRGETGSKGSEGTVLEGLTRG